MKEEAAMILINGWNIVDVDRNELKEDTRERICAMKYIDDYSFVVFWDTHSFEYIAAVEGPIEKKWTFSKFGKAMGYLDKYIESKIETR
jgi:hypothetical protein